MGPRVLALTNMSAKLIVTNVFPLTCLYQQNELSTFGDDFLVLLVFSGDDAEICFRFTAHNVHDDG